MVAGLLILLILIGGRQILLFHRLKIERAAWQARVASVEGLLEEVNALESLMVETSVKQARISQLALEPGIQVNVLRQLGSGIPSPVTIQQIHGSTRGLTVQGYCDAYRSLEQLVQSLKVRGVFSSVELITARRTAEGRLQFELWCGLAGEGKGKNE